VDETNIHEPLWAKQGTARNPEISKSSQYRAAAVQREFGSEIDLVIEFQVIFVLTIVRIVSNIL